MTHDPLARERIVPGTAHWEASWADHIQRYRFALDFVRSDARVLDAGCGVGYGAAEIARHAGAHVVAVDISEDALDIARTHFDAPSITWCRDDCHTLARAAELAPFDVIVNFENLEHLERPEDFVVRAASLLADDGVLITSTPDRLLLNRLRGAPADAASENPWHVSELSESELRALLGHSFASVQVWYQYPVGIGALRLHARALAARLGVGALISRTRSVLRRHSAVGSTGADERARGAFLHEWRIGPRRPVPDLAWTLIAVCREPVRSG
jgi:SAM-dependent methyltransferase